MTEDDNLFETKDEVGEKRTELTDVGEPDDPVDPEPESPSDGDADPEDTDGREFLKDDEEKGRLPNNK